MLATATDTLPTGEGWAFEPKWDGFRALARVDGGVATFRSRNDNDLTARFAAAARARRARGALALRGARRRDLRPRRDRAIRGSGCSSRAPARSSSPPSTCSRSTASRSSTGPTPSGARRSSSSSTRPSAVFSSRRRSTTAPRSSAPRASTGSRASSPSWSTRRTGPGAARPDWRKLKLKSRQELVIAGFTRGQGRRASGIGALVLGVHAADGLRYAGNVGTGFTDRELDRLEAMLKPLRRPTTPFAEVPKMPKVRSARRHLGRAVARRRDRVRRVDTRRPAARARLPRPARG